VLLFQPWSQDTVFGVSEATLLRGFRMRVAEVGGLRTRYWVAGTGQPLVLVHGLGGAAVNFTSLAPLLARRRRVLVPDLPGHGGTEALREGGGLTEIAGHVAAVAAHEQMGPTAVVGYSMGGLVALRLSLARPELVSALVLVATAGIVSTTRRAELWLGAASTLRPARVAARFQHAIARRPNLRLPVFGYWGTDDPKSLPPEAVIGFLAAQSEHTGVSAASKALFGDDPRLDLERIACPTLVVWGARDRLIPLEDGFEYARRLGCPLRVLPGVGHLVIGEQPAELAAIVEEFLASA
jgi:3-oxoadipate enol-lactonase